MIRNRSIPDEEPLVQEPMLDTKKIRPINDIEHFG
jgi:hypothetical protein